VYAIHKLAYRAALFSAGAGLIVTAAVSAQAKDGRRDVPTQNYQVKKAKDGTVKYCVTVPPTTGTWLPHKVCKTQQQWKDLGVTLNLN